MEIALKLLIGFAVFFTGVVLNVTIMKRVQGKPTGIMPLLSFVIIIAGLVTLVTMAATIDVAV